MRLIALFLFVVFLSVSVRAQEVQINIDILDTIDRDYSSSNSKSLIKLVNPSALTEKIKLIAPKSVQEKYQKTISAPKNIVKPVVVKKEKQNHLKQVKKADKIEKVSPTPVTKVVQTPLPKKKIVSKSKTLPITPQPQKIQPVKEVKVKPVDLAIPSNDVKNTMKSNTSIDSIKSKSSTLLSTENISKDELDYIDEDKTVTKNKGETIIETPKTESIETPTQKTVVKPEPKSIKSKPVLSKTETSTAKEDIIELLPNGSTLLSLSFEAGITSLDTSIISDIQAKISPYKEDSTKSFRIVGYASSQGEEFKARRFSLTRAVNTRLVLLDMDIHSSRIEIQALGDKSPDDNQDKVDIIILEK